MHFKDRIKFAWEQVIETAKKVAPYVLIGVGIGAFIHNWIPEEWIVRILGTGNPIGVIIAMEYGVMSVPALVVNNKVVSTGKVLKTENVQKLLQKIVSEK